jgi:hypothetical protein
MRINGVALAEVSEEIICLSDGLFSGWIILNGIVCWSRADVAPCGMMA